MHAKQLILSTNKLKYIWIYAIILTFLFILLSNFQGDLIYYIKINTFNSYSNEFGNLNSDFLYLDHLSKNINNVKKESITQFFQFYEPNETWHNLALKSKQHSMGQVYAFSAYYDTNKLTKPLENFNKFLGENVIRIIAITKTNRGRRFRENHTRLIYEVWNILYRISCYINKLIAYVQLIYAKILSATNICAMISHVKYFDMQYSPYSDTHPDLYPLWCVVLLEAWQGTSEKGQNPKKVLKIAFSPLFRRELPENHGHPFTTSIIYCPTRFNENSTSSYHTNDALTPIGVALYDYQSISTLKTIHQNIALSMTPAYNAKQTVRYDKYGQLYWWLLEIEMDIIGEYPFLYIINQLNPLKFLHVTKTAGIANETSKKVVGKNRFKIHVCIPPFFGAANQLLFFFLQTMQTIEWNRIMGANKITLYMESMPDSHITLFDQLIQYYVSQSYKNENGNLFRIESIQWNLPDQVRGRIHYHGQVAHIQDCLYRNGLDNADYILFHDVDEMLYNEVDASTYQVLLTKLLRHVHFIEGKGMDKHKMTFNANSDHVCGFLFQSRYMDTPIERSKNHSNYWYINRTKIPNNIGTKLNTINESQYFDVLTKIYSKSLLAHYGPIRPQDGFYPHKIRSKYVIAPKFVECLAIHQPHSIIMGSFKEMRKRYKYMRQHTLDNSACFVYSVPHKLAYIKHFSKKAIQKAARNPVKNYNDNQTSSQYVHANKNFINLLKRLDLAINHTITNYLSYIQENNTKII